MDFFQSSKNIEGTISISKLSFNIKNSLFFQKHLLKFKISVSNPLKV